MRETLSEQRLVTEIRIEGPEAEGLAAAAKAESNLVSRRAFLRGSAGTLGAALAAPTTMAGSHAQATPKVAKGPLPDGLYVGLEMPSQNPMPACVVEGLTDIGLNYINFFTGQSKDLTQTVEQISDAGQQVVYDHFVGASLLGTARLIFLTGISVSPDTLQAIAKRVREGATCVALRSLAWTLVPETSAGGTTTSPSGQGKWVITDDFADPAVRAQVEPFLGNPQEIRYQFGKHELRLRAMDGDPNRIRC